MAWTDPSPAGTLDLATNDTVPESWFDAIIADLLVLGGVTGVIPSAALTGLGLEEYVAAVTENVVNDVDPGGTAWTDLDLTAQTSATATRVLLALQYTNDTRASSGIRLRPNGSGATGISTYTMAGLPTGTVNIAQAICGLDAGQVLEYGTGEIAGDGEHVYISVIGYWQPA